MGGGRADRAAVDLEHELAVCRRSVAGTAERRGVLAVDNEPMTTIEWNKSHVYWIAFAGFVLMALRSVQVTWLNWRQGYSILEKPEAFDGVDE